MLKKLRVKELVADFGYQVTNPKYADLNREIKGFGLDRKGLELSGLAVNSYYQGKIVGWGTKEKLFLQEKNFHQRQEAYHNVFTTQTPLIFLSKSFDESLASEIKEIANKFKIPLIKYHSNISSLQPNLNTYLLEHQAKTKIIHASFVIVHGLGVLITGKSGIGKSEAVIELVHNNHIFVSDDTVEAYRIGSNLYGKAAKITKDFLEARGIGLVNVPYIYGAKVMAEKAKIDLIIELVAGQERDFLDRIGDKSLHEKIEECIIPKIQIPTGSGRSIAVLIEAAANVFLAKKKGINPILEMQRRRDE